MNGTAFCTKSKGVQEAQSSCNGASKLLGVLAVRVRTGPSQKRVLFLLWFAKSLPCAGYQDRGVWQAVDNVHKLRVGRGTRLDPRPAVLGLGKVQPRQCRWCTTRLPLAAAAAAEVRGGHKQMGGTQTKQSKNCRTFQLNAEIQKLKGPGKQLPESCWQK